MSESTWFFEQPSVVICTVGVAIPVRLPPAPQDVPTVHGMWHLTHMAEGSGPLEPVNEQVAVTLSNDEGRIAGSAGCNRYFAAGSFDEPPTMYATTMMMCPEEVMAVERAYLAALTSCTRLVEDQGALRGEADDGTTLLVWMSRPT